MTDNEIIKALESCMGCDCAECPCCDETDIDVACCKDILIIEALKLVNRQKAEIEEHERAFETILKEVRAARALYIEDIGKARAEAIKEFAEKVKDIVDEPDLIRGRVIDVIIEKIDNLVKEMTEGSNGTM